MYPLFNESTRVVFLQGLALATGGLAANRTFNYSYMTVTAAKLT